MFEAHKQTLDKLKKASSFREAEVPFETLVLQFDELLQAATKSAKAKPLPKGKEGSQNG